MSSAGAPSDNHWPVVEIDELVPSDGFIMLILSRISGNCVASTSESLSTQPLVSKWLLS